MRYELHEYESWSGAPGNELVDTLTGERIVSDGWVADAPEDATLDRGYAALVDLVNELYDRWRNDVIDLLHGRRVDEINEQVKEES